MSIQIEKIGQIAITVSDIEAALRFYRDILDLKFLFSPSDNLAFLQCGATRIMFSTPQGEGEVGKNSILYLSVPDLEQFFEQVVTLGASAERSPQLVARLPDHELWMAFLKDPDGNIVGLMEERAIDS